MVKDGYNEDVDKYRHAKTEGKTWLAELEAQEREKTGIKNLKIKYNKVFGYYLEVTNSYKDMSDRVAYFVQFNGQFQDGIYHKSATNYSQYNVRSNIDIQVTKGIKLGFDLNARQQHKNYSAFGASGDRSPSFPS